jgi:hypothetical protein
MNLPMGQPSLFDNPAIVSANPVRRAFSHERVITGKDEWLTPPEILRALGKFDLDPCAPASRPWGMAGHHYTAQDNGLIQPWFGRVWLNPPYGRMTIAWMRLLKRHGNGIAMIFARTETRTFFECVWGVAGAILFLKGRITFYNADGSKPNNTGGAPSCLIAYGAENVAALRSCGVKGHLIVLKTL